MTSTPPSKQQNNTTFLSITQQQIHSHQIIHNILSKCIISLNLDKNNVIQHNINRITTPIFYNKDNHKQEKINKSKIFNQQNKYNNDKQKIKNIYKQIVNQTTVYQKIKSNSNNNKRYQNKSHTINQNYYRNKSVSISGLISYNFRSVKARKRIAFDSNHKQQQSQIQQHRRCSSIRSEKIHLKTDPQRAQFDMQFTNAINHSYPQLTTSEYLSALQKQQNTNKIIYGHKDKHLSMMSKIMSIQKSNVQQAEYSIKEIQKLKERKKSKRQKKLKINNQIFEFQKRRIPQKQSKILISFIYQ